MIQLEYTTLLYAGLLFGLLLSGLPLSRSRENAEGTIVYRPAGGYYVCPEAGMVCTIVSCYIENGCIQFLKNFEHVPNLNEFEDKNETVLVSMGPHASVVLGLGDAEVVECDSRCSCQPLVSEDEGTCQVEAPSPVSFTSLALSSSPSSALSALPSLRPSKSRTSLPSQTPTTDASPSPSTALSTSPSLRQSRSPINLQSQSPKVVQSFSPSNTSSVFPSLQQTRSPITLTSQNPTTDLSLSPSNVLSTSPSLQESSSPTFLPSQIPTMVLSLSPTNTPSTLPSLRPSNNPTKLPTKSPTQEPTLTSAIFAILADVSGSALLDPQSPQSKAAQWILEHDKITYNTTTQLSRLHQRYALVALDFAFHENDASRLDWTDPDADECFWSGVSCAHFDGVPYVRHINWARRKLTGKPLPEFSLFPALETLDLAQNALLGSLDPFYSLEYLTELYLFDNLFSGPIGDNIGNLHRLERLYLNANELTGTLSSGLWESDRDRPLQWLILGNNNLEGSLPMGMRLGHLRYLDISHNEFTSSIPSDWPTLLLTMRTLYIDHNRLRGTIPEDFAKIGKGWLKQFYANDNKLEGRFPQGWNPIWYLTNIDIRNNRFTRDMPSSVCSMSAFDRAELVELRADCDICDCSRPLCDNCRGK